MKKKILALILMSTLGLTACGTNSAEKDSTTETESVVETETVALGETVSTDLADFTLDAATFTYYASANSASYAEPIDESDGGIFTASMGHVLVPMTFTINNKDRTNLDIGGDFGAWKLNFTIIYDGTEYPVKGYALNSNDGSGGLRLSFGAVSYDGGKTFKMHDTGNELQNPGIETYRVVGVAALDPEALDDSFELKVQVLNSAGEYEYFTYEIE